MRSAALAAIAFAVLAPGCGERGRAVPHGELITFWSGRSGHPGVWVMRPDGSGEALLTRFPENAKRGVLSPDGRTVAFDGASSGKPPMEDFDVQVMGIDGEGRRTIAGTRERETDPRWSPDGRLISFSRQPGDAVDRSWIWVVRPDGTHPRRIGRGLLARWSPDGRRIAFAVNDGAQNDLYVMDSGGRHRERLTRTREDEEPAAFSRDGARLLYTRYGEAGAGTAYELDLRTRRTRRIASGTAADISPDGTRILLSRDGHVVVTRADGSAAADLSPAHADDEATSWR